MASSSFHAYSSWKHPTSYAISKSGLHLSRKISPTLAVSKSQPVLSLKKQSPGKIPPLKLTAKQSRFLGWEQVVRHRGSAQIPVIKSTSSESSSGLYDVGSENEVGDNLSPAVGILFCTWHLLTLVFYGLTRDVYVYFRFPFFVSAAQLLVSVTWCSINWLFGFHKPPLNMNLLKVLAPIAAAHAIGIAMSNFCMVSFGGSLPNIIKAFEPLFSAAASQMVLGYQFPFSLWLSVATVVTGVLLTSTKYSFNWLGFISATMFTTSFTYRNIYLKKAMKHLDSASLYAYTSLIALCFCVPLTILIEGPKLMQYGFKDAITMFGTSQFLFDILVLGAFYHITSKIAITTLEKVDPVTQAVGNISERLFLICFSIMIFGVKVSRRMGIGTLIAVCGIIIYSKVKSNLERQRNDQGPS